MKKYISISSIINTVRKMLIFHCLRMYLEILSSCLNTFGFGIWFLYYLFKVPLLVMYINISLLLDRIFFPNYRHVKIENPVFIIGHPRSATTFLHTILTQTEEFLVFKNWELNNPSLTIRKFLRHFKIFQIFFSLIFDLRYTPNMLRRAIKNKKGRTKGAEGGFKGLRLETGSVAQEEEILFQLILDSQFVSIVTPLGFVKKGYPELCFNDEQPHQERSVSFLTNCFKRQIYYTGKKQIIAKMNFSLFRIKTLLKYFPDVKIIYIARSPLETIPSHLSLHHELLDRFFGLDNIPKDKLKQYYKHRYQYNILFYKYFDDLMNNNEIPKDQILEITYNSIKNDLWNALKQIKSFANLQVSPELEDRLKIQDKEQSSYERKHKNLPLETFNLTEEKIRADFDFVFKRYEFN